MTDIAEADETIPVEELTPEEANRIIHSHRKVRYGKCATLFHRLEPFAKRTLEL
jgi:hypothetical protein